MSYCYDCGGEFRWVATPDGLRPLNRTDDKPHWLTCKSFKRKAKQRRKAALRHERPTMTPAKAIRGENYQPSCGGCDTPPWEECSCSALLDPVSNRLHLEAANRLAILEPELELV